MAALCHQSFKEAMFGGSAGPWRLWWVTPSHSGVMQPTSSYCLGNIFLSNQTLSLIMSYHTYTFYIFISNWSSSGFSLISLFFFLCRCWGCWRRWQSWKGMHAPEVRGTPGARVGHGDRYPCKPASGTHVSAKVHRADEPSPNYFWGPFSWMWRDEWAPLSFRAGPQREPVVPQMHHCITGGHWRRIMTTSQEVPLPPVLSKSPLLSPWEALHSHWHCRGNLQSSTMSLNWVFLLDPSSASQLEGLWQRCTYVGSAKSTPQTGSQWCLHCFQEHHVSPV